MVASTVLALTVEAAVALARFVFAFYAFWLVLRALEGLLPEDLLAVRELDPLACEFTDPFVSPVSRWTRLSSASACWLWLVAFAAVDVALGRLPGLV